MLRNPYYDYPTASFDGMPTVWLAEFNGIVVSTRNEEKEWKEDFFPPGTRIRHFMRSMEVEVFSKDELEIYGELTTDYMDYELKLRMDPGNQVWREEAATMRRELVQAFGNDLWFLANKELTE
jgi:hypothetical protein